MALTQPDVPYKFYANFLLYFFSHGLLFFAICCQRLRLKRPYFDN